MSQASLFDSPARVQSPHPGKLHRAAGEAEKRAAKAVTPKSGTQRFTILSLITEYGHFGTTQWEIVNRSGLLRSSVCPRFKELEEGGWIEKTGRLRKSPLNTHESLYRATSRGHAAVMKAVAS